MALRDSVVTASRAASMSASGGFKLGSVPARRPHPNQDSGTKPAIASQRLPPSWAMTVDSGSRLLTRSPNGPVSSAGTSGRTPTLLPIEADVRLASVDGSPNPPAPIESRAFGLAGEAAMLSEYPGTPPEKMTAPPPRPVASRIFSYAHCAHPFLSHRHLYSETYCHVS